MATKPLRVVSEEERDQSPPLSLIDAVESGDVLEMLRAQRRLIANALKGAADNTAPQLNNELNKLHVLITAEEKRRAAETEEAEASGRTGTGGRRSFSPAAI